MEHICQYCGLKKETGTLLGSHVPWCKKNPNLSRNKRVIRPKKRERVEITKACPKCNSLFTVLRIKNRTRDVVPQRGEHSFCSLQCANSRKERVTRLCKNCGEVVHRWGKIFCSIKCQQDLRYKEYIKRWLLGEETGGNEHGVSAPVRKWLFEKYGRFCQKCDWAEVNPKTKVVPVEVNHIDGNPLNNRPENLEIICPNCHSLTVNFRNLNRGSGRSYRRKAFLV